MKTLVIRVEALDGNVHGYPIHLCLEDGAPDWLTHPRASAVIPEELSVAAPPQEPGTTAALTAQRVVELVLTQAGPSDKLPAAGVYLFRLLFPPPIEAGWDQVRGEFPGEGLLTVLDIRPEKLARLPWELMRRTTAPAEMPLFLDTANPWLRGEIDFGHQTPPDWWPIRALIVVGCKADDDIATEAENEVAAIEAAFRRLRPAIDWEVHRRPSKAALRGELQLYHPNIFHFIGHGRSAGVEAGGGSLEIWDEKAGQFEDWTAAEIRVNLAASPPCVAFLNACQSSQVGDHEGAWSVTQAFVAAKVPAVLGVQANIKGSVAADFAAALYQALAERKPLEIALIRAREAIYQPDRRDWCLASLTLSVSPSQVLQMQPQIDDQVRQEMAFADIFDFVDRCHQRRDLWFGVDPFRELEQYRSLLVVEGDPSVGKTWLVRRCLEGCALRGRRILYVDLHRNSMPFLDVLHAIRQGDPDNDWSICHPLDESAFWKFNRDLGFLLEGKLPPDTEPQGPVDAPEGAWKGGEERLESRFFASFREALVRAAGGKPLILVLDDVALLPTEFNYLLRYLIRPIAQRQVGDVRMILVLGGGMGQFEQYALHTLGKLCARVTVSAFSRAEYVQWATEFCRHYSVNWSAANQIIQGIAQLPEPTWKPTDLRDLWAILGRPGPL